MPHADLPKQRPALLAGNSKCYQYRPEPSTEPRKKFKDFLPAIRRSVEIRKILPNLAKFIPSPREKAQGEGRVFSRRSLPAARAFQ
jgi:hypothetical protein